jgi:hypothetical protein
MQVRERSGRSKDPSVVVLDSQSVRAANSVRKATIGLDAAKKTPGRKHGLAVDMIGLIIAVVVVAASAPREGSVPGAWHRHPASGIRHTEGMRFETQETRHPRHPC